MGKEIMSLFGTNRLKWTAVLRKWKRANIISYENSEQKLQERRSCVKEINNDNATNGNVTSTTQRTTNEIAKEFSRRRNPERSTSSIFIRLKT